MINKNEIQKQLAEKLKAKGLSGNKAAPQMNISPATLSNILNEKDWNLISDAVWNRVAAWVGFDNWTIINTASLIRCNLTCDDARNNKRMMAIIAYTGAGKTKSLTLYGDKNPETYYVLCRASMQKKDFLKAIQLAMGIDMDGSIYHRINSITAKLNSDNAPLLILDDAGKLVDGCLRLIQEIYDATEGRTGIVIAGLPALRNYITKMASKDKSGFREFKRRIGYWQPLNRPTEKIIAEFCLVNGVKDETAIRYIYNTCKDLGTLREMLTNATRAAGGKAITVDLLEKLHVGETAFKTAA